MDYVVEIKEEPADESYEVHQQSELNDKEDLPEQSLNGNAVNNHFPSLHSHVKVEADVEADGTEHKLDDVEVSNEASNRKRKSSTALLNILSSNGQINHYPGTDSGSTKPKKLRPTLTALLNRSNVSTLPSVQTESTDVRVQNTNGTNVSKNHDKPTLQKLLTSPMNGPSPLLSSMLKTPGTSRTNLTIDKLFNSAPGNVGILAQGNVGITAPGNVGISAPGNVGIEPKHIISNTSLSSMLGHQNDNSSPSSSVSNTDMTKNSNLNGRSCSSQNSLVDSAGDPMKTKTKNNPPITIVTDNVDVKSAPVTKNSSLALMLGHKTVASDLNLTTMNYTNKSDGTLDKRINELLGTSLGVNGVEGKIINNCSPSAGSQNVKSDLDVTAPNVLNNKSTFDGICSKSLDSKNGSVVRKLLTSNQDVTKNSGNNLPQISAPQIQTVMRMPDNTGTGSKEVLLPSVKTGDFEKSLKEIKSIPKEFQNEQFINMWTDIITQKVISEFSKDVNATLNSFVKKAIMDSLSVSSSPPAESGPQVTAGATKIPEHNTGMGQISSLASSLLNSLTVKVGECTTNLPNIHAEDQVKKEPEGLDHGDNGPVVIIDDDDDDIEDTKDKNAWKKSKLFGKFTMDSLDTPAEPQETEELTTEFSWPYSTSSPSNNPYIVTKIKGVVKKPTHNVSMSSTVQSSLSGQDQVQPTISNQILSNQLEAIQKEVPETELSAAAQMVLHPIRGPDGKYLVYSCNICGKRFQHHGTLSVHQRTHLLENGTSDYKCDICGKVCTAKRYLDIHMRTHQSEAIPIGPKVTCEVCGKDFTSEENLIIHKRLHTGEKLYQCEICHTGFTRNSQLAIHMRIHSGEKPYICNVCGKTFRQSNGLSLHMNIHTDDKPYKCEICGFGFSRKAHYMKHMRKERGERPFRCSDCGKGFTDKFNLTMHSRTHQKDKPHVCQICGKGYVQNTHLRNHLKFHTGEKGYTCPHCFERFEIKKVLLSHLNTVHKDKEDNVTTSRPRRNVTKTFKVDPDNDTDEEDGATLDGDSNSGNCSDRKDKGAKYSDMIMHITQGFDDSTNEDDDLSQDYTTGLSSDVSNVKVEPMGFEFSSESLKSSFSGNALLDFDPSIVKDEPEDYMQDDLTESSSFIQSGYDEKTIKAEPIDT